MPAFRKGLQRQGFSCIHKPLRNAGSAGKYNDPGLPNVTGKLQGGDTSGVTIWAHRLDHGALSSVLNTKSYASPAGQAQEYYDIEIDASLSNNIFGASDTVMPKSADVIIAIYLGIHS